jgi:peroxiredoxin
MKLIWHILKKDFGRQYLIFLLCILCGTYVGVMTRQGGNSFVQGSVVFQDWLLLVATISFYAFLFILIVETVQEDSLIDSTAFWQTRPISSGRLLAAKGMFILGLLLVKFLVSLAMWLFLPNPDHKAFGSWDIWLGMLSFVLLSGGLAACTKNLGKCFLGLAMCLIFFSVASALADQWFRPVALQRMHQAVAEMTAQIHNQGFARHNAEQTPWFAHLSSSMVLETIIGIAGAVAMLIQYFTRRTAVAFSVLFVAVLGAGVASNYYKWNAVLGTASASPAVKLDPQVQSILAGATKFYADAQSFEADIESVTHVETDAGNRDRDASFHIALQRPASFSLVLKTGSSGGTLISNGKTLIAYMPASKKYTSTDAPADLSELLSPRNLLFIESGLALGFEDLLRQDSVEAFEAKIRRSEYIGSEKIGDVAAQHIRLTETTSVTDYWIADGPQPLLLQAQVTANLPGRNGPTKMVRTSTYTNWHVNQPLAVDTFQFQPPPEAKLGTESFARTRHPLVGRMERDFQLNDLEGKPVKLSDLHGKIVVIDFWTTSCSASLPVVTEATSTRKTQGVVFYAVNLMESADTIRAFQKDKGLDFPVLLDTDGLVDKHYFAKHYLNKGTPQLVLIDKDGQIEAVKVGYTPGFKNELGQQLDDMIAGKSLLPEVAPSTPAKGP